MKNNINFMRKKADTQKTAIILALSWRDLTSPTAGGAEVQTHAMLSKIDTTEYKVVHISPRYKSQKQEEIINGVEYIRKGNIITVILHAFIYYKKHRHDIKWVIDQCNTHRFFTPLWVPKEKRIFYIHQLTREIWDINCHWPINKIGKILETSMLRLNRNDWTIALSESTRQDLLQVGFDNNRIIIIPPILDVTPWPKTNFLPKEENTFVYVGRYSGYKGIDAAVEALGLLKKQYSNSHLWILGKKDDHYISTVLLPLCQKYNLSIGDSNKECDVVCWGFVSETKKMEYLSASTALVFPSIREGWGIPISEAAFVGTPSIVYDSEGLKDAINYGKAGYLCEEKNSKALYMQMKRILENPDEYLLLRNAAYEFSISYLKRDYQKEINGLLHSISG